MLHSSLFGIAQTKVVIVLRSTVCCFYGSYSGTHKFMASAGYWWDKTPLWFLAVFV